MPVPRRAGASVPPQEECPRARVQGHGQCPTRDCTDLGSAAGPLSPSFLDALPGLFPATPELATAAHTHQERHPRQRGLSPTAFPGAAASSLYGSVGRPAIVVFLKSKMRVEV